MFSAAKLRMFFQLNSINGVDNLQKGFVYLYKQKRFLEVDNFSFYDKNSVKESFFLVSLQPKR